MYRDHSVCRACGRGLTDTVFDLGIQPLANDFRLPKDERNGFAPLKVLFCEECALGQLSVVVNPWVLYDNYAYITSRSETMKRHFEQLKKDIASEIKNDTIIPGVVEIGSNDGALLEYINAVWECPVIGIDPAENLAGDASNRGVKNIISVFDEESAKDAL